MSVARLLLLPLLVTPAAFARAWTPTVRTELRVIHDRKVFLQDDTPPVGLEGGLTPTGRATLWAGPDQHRFTRERRPGAPATCTLPFIESAVTWAPNVADALTATARHQLWPGSGGRSVYRERKADVTWIHHAANRIDTSLRTGLLHGNFGGFAATGRNDNVFTAGALASRPLACGCKADGGLTREWTQSCILNTPGRAYARWLMSVGVVRNW